MKPAKSDVMGFVDLPETVEDKYINVHIEDAYKFDIKPRLGQLGIDIYNLNDNTKPELKTFYMDFVLEWWCRLAYYRFFEVHGLNVTQFGITKTRDPQGTFDQVEEKDKAVRLRRMKSDNETLYSLLRVEEWDFDDTKYRKSNECRTSTDSGGGINAIG